MTNMTDKLYFNKKNLNSLESFVAEKDEGIFVKEITKTFAKFEKLLEKRFVPLEDESCFDTKAVGCWPYLCKENYEEYQHLFNQKYFYSGQDIKVIYDYFKDKEFKIDGEKWDIPTKEELLVLTNLANVPFEIHDKYKRPISFTASSLLYKYSENKIQGFDFDVGYMKNSDTGYPYPISRLSEDKTISHKKMFQLFIEKKLKPVGFDDTLYDTLLKDDFKNLDKFIDVEYIINNLQVADNKRANLREYDSKIFYDVNSGSWEVFAKSKPLSKENIAISLPEKLCARDPRADIVDGIIGIDFGTKSTVVVASKENEKIFPLRVGIGDWDKEIQAHHYENPTVMEFVDLDAFLADYKRDAFRPYTNYKDLTIAHKAYESLKNSNSKDFNAYLHELKQWAGDKHRKLKIKDKDTKTTFELKPFLELQKEDINPIEIYAYYLGLYINNQYNGIYLNYILSFPVTYEMGIRKKILESFKAGLKKSLPNIGDEIQKLTVDAGVSEPAAYAAIALQKYGFEEKERSFYAIFDFGGGTTDFDFGIFRWSDEEGRKESRFDYVIEHFGAGGDKYLGGENLLELLAYEVFKKNQNILRKEKISFELPPQCHEFLGSEVLLNESREAKLNMLNLIDKLRPFWEREDFKEAIFKEKLSVNLYDNDGVMKSETNLKIDEKELLAILKERIKKGVDAFFENLREVFSNYTKEIDLDVDEINIFLAGNSSKSPLVRELFDAKIEAIKAKASKDGYELEYKLFEPLDNKENFEEPNGKTGVAYGLIETRPSGKILIVDKNLKQDEIKFAYYLGISKRKKFKVKLSKEQEYGVWVPFIDASYSSFEVYYTSLASATTNSMNIKDTSIKRKILDIKDVDEDKNVYIRLINPTTFEYGVGSNESDVKVCSKVELS